MNQGRAGRRRSSFCVIAIRIPSGLHGSGWGLGQLQCTSLNSKQRPSKQAQATTSKPVQHGLVLSDSYFAPSKPHQRLATGQQSLQSCPGLMRPALVMSGCLEML